MARRKLGEILIQAGVLDDAALRAALGEQRRWGGHLGRILVDMNLVSEEVLVQALSQQLNFPVVNLEHRGIHPDVLELVAADLAEQHGVVPFNREGKFLDVAMIDPTNLGIIDELRIRTQLNVRPYLAGPKALEKALARFYGKGTAGFASHTYDPRFLNSPELPANMQVVDLGGKTPPPATAPGPAPAGPTVAAGPALTPQVTLRTAEQAAEVRALQERISRLEALVARDEEVLRKLLGLMVEKGIASREEILERLK
jgi:type IV pilus assembly protein PilB